MVFFAHTKLKDCFLHTAFGHTLSPLNSAESEWKIHLNSICGVHVGQRWFAWNNWLNYRLDSLEHFYKKFPGWLSRQPQLSTAFSPKFQEKAKRNWKNIHNLYDKIDNAVMKLLRNEIKTKFIRKDLFVFYWVINVCGRVITFCLWQNVVKSLVDYKKWFVGGNSTRNIRKYSVDHWKMLRKS
jgi:hypothetical protein